jgi:ABC-type antimicrobial peptide transport system permease subunit
VPVVLEKTTAEYSLHLGGRVRQTYDIRDGSGRPLRLFIVGLLGPSIFQGDLLISERAFLQHFPDQSGYRFFLIETPSAEAASVQKVQRILERTLGDFGFTTETTGQRLAAFLAVQNTYLSTFQSLGGLGLLLGTFGLAAVQLRSVLERRGELALLRAVGFRRRLLAAMVTLENAMLLVAGLACGVLSAAVAVLPHFWSGSASIPWGSLAATLGLVLAVGLLAGLTAVRSALRSPLLAALRGD